MDCITSSPIVTDDLTNQYRKLDLNYTIKHSCSILVQIMSNNTNQRYNANLEKFKIK